MLIPILQYISEGSAVYQNKDLSFIWKTLIKVTDFFGVPINLGTLLALAFIPILVRQLFYYLRHYFPTKIRYKAIAQIRKEIVSEILKADMSFFIKQGQGNLVSAVTLEAQRAGNLIFQSVNLLASLVLLLIYVILLFILQPYLTAISIAIFLGTFLLTFPFIRISKKYGEEITKQNTNMQKQIGDKIYGIRLIKMFSQEINDSRRIGKVIDMISHAMMKADITGEKIISLTEPVIVFAVFIILYMAVNWLGMKLANLGLFLFILYRTVPHIKEINTKWQAVNANFQSLEYAKKIIREAKHSLNITSGPIDFEGLKNEIAFDNVSFSYDGELSENYVLRNVSFSIPRGSFLAIVGGSGSGKSTLVDLIPRLLEVTRGEIRIDGIPIKNLNLKSLRSKIGFLTQEPFLFNDTVMDNIIYGHHGEVSFSEVEKAAKGAFIHDFILKIPEGYNTILGDRGTRLSGGERQRLAMARVLFQGPEILILDEPTSALDSESEKYIQETLEGLKRKITIIMVAHRLSTVKQADQILVIDNGRIVEKGDFSALFERNGYFRQLFEIQLNQVMIA